MRTILFYCLFILLISCCCTPLKNIEDIKHSIYVAHIGGGLGWAMDSIIFLDSTFLYIERLYEGDGMWNLSSDGKFLELQGRKESLVGWRKEINLRLQIKSKDKLREVGDGINRLFLRCPIIEREDIENSMYVFYENDTIIFLDSTFLYTDGLNRGGGVWDLSPYGRAVELEGRKDSLKGWEKEISLKLGVRGIESLRELGGRNRSFIRVGGSTQ